MSKIYLAGKITKKGWRERLVWNLHGSTWADAPLDFAGHLYTGPFFVACDHGCYHVPTGHGSINTGLKACGDDFSTITRGEVHRRCLAAIDDCDVLLAWISEHQCYGTIAEIQYALLQGRKVVVAIAPKIATPTRNEFWFVTIAAHRVEFNVTENDLTRLVGEL